MEIQDIIAKLGLSPLSGEGGMFRRTYLSSQVIKKEALSTPYPEDKPAGSAIMYMVTPNCYSRLHRLPTDEVYHFYLGSPVQLLLIPPEAEPFTVTLGQDIMAGMQVQYTVPAGYWQGSRLADGGDWALLGTTMAPAYSDTDYEDAPAEELMKAHPAFSEEIHRLTLPAQFDKL